MNRKILLAALGSAAAFAVTPTAGIADPVTPSVFSEGVVSFFNGNTNAQLSTSCFNFSSAGATVGCSGTTTTPTTGSTLSYLTTATASYGTLKAGGQSTNSGASGVSNTTDYSSSYGQADFEDSWLITGGTGTATLKLMFALDGNYNFCSIGAGAVTGFSLINLDGGPSTSASLISGCSGTTSQNVALTTTFTYGTPLDFLVNLLAGSNIFDLGKNVSSNVDFSDTASMSAIVVTDSEGDPLPFFLTTASGASAFSALAAPPPPPPATGVPEPWTLSLFGAGLAGAAMLRRKPTG